MWIQQLSLIRFRLFQQFSAQFSPGINFIYGKNGSGKSSLLEAIALFGLGRSFRKTPIKGLTKVDEKQPFQASLTIQEQINEPLPICEQLWVTDEGSPHQLRFRCEDGGLRSAEMVRKVPLQLLSSSSFQVLEAGPEYRRQWLDWGCFFFSPQYARVWQHFLGILKHRNALLRTVGTKGTSASDQKLCAAWDQAFLKAAEAVDAIRQRYWQYFEPAFRSALQTFLPQFTWELRYALGWPVAEGASSAESLEVSLKRQFWRECSLGYTSLGPHRADLTILANERPAKQWLSRGQTKLLICAVLMARAQILYQTTGRSCVLLVDDIDAELDNQALEKLFEGLQGLKIQWIATSLHHTTAWPDKMNQQSIYI